PSQLFSGSVSDQLKVTVSNTANAGLQPNPFRTLPWVFAGVLAVMVLGLIKLPGRRRIMLLTVFLVAVMSSCGGGGGGAPPPTPTPTPTPAPTPTPGPPTNATLTVTGTSGANSFSITLSLTITH